MTTLGPLACNLDPQPTVKCSTCEDNVELARLADHRCSGPATGKLHLGHDSTSDPDFMAVTDAPFTAEPTEIEESQSASLPKRGASLYQRQRPPLPKIDSNVPGKVGRELGPREAANIAHDLGLPSPTSAGSGRRSPRPMLPRKASSPRIPLAPVSPELPISQDCAFPPFPTNRPKRTQTVKDTHTPKPRSISRANTHDATLSHSTSSSLYSTGSSALNKSRTSDASSNLRSRQGTLNENPSPPSTAPSSPRESFEQRKELGKATGLSYNLNPNQPPELANFTPPASAIPISTIDEIDETQLSSQSQYVTSNDDFEELEASASRDEPLSYNEGSNTAVTFDNLAPTAGLQTLITPTSAFPEPSYKSKRPPALDQISMIPPERQFPAINSKSQAVPMTAGLGRTLTKIFGRKRSQSTSSKKAAHFDVNSPRMKALAPELPLVPPKSESEMDSGNHSDKSYFSHPVGGLQADTSSITEGVSPLSASEEVMVPRGTHTSHRDVVSPISTIDQSSAIMEDNGTAKSTLSPSESQFDFKFDDESGTKSARKTDTLMIQSDFEDNLSKISPSPDARPEISLQRASIDSASSYGSVRFSQHTISTRSSPPPSDELRNKISNALRASTITIDSQESSHVATNGQSSDYQNDTALQLGRLPPVLENTRTDEFRDSRNLSSPEKNTRSPISATNSGDFGSRSPRSRRPITPAGNKGTCRGCSNVIELGQKSISSKDGRLTGRYHKDCFGCQTCRQPFLTADFYVYEDHPYCSHHYHVLNNTLCTSCDQGIEGQFFETTDVAGHEPKKFHPRCLTCATCRLQLKDDYFEFQGYVYCERDAFRAANGPVRSVYDNAPSRPSPLNREYLSSGEPGTKGRFPERRTTKLMMN